MPEITGGMPEITVQACCRHSVERACEAQGRSTSILEHASAVPLREASEQLNMLFVRSRLENTDANTKKGSKAGGDYVLSAAAIPRFTYVRLAAQVMHACGALP